MSAQSPSRIDEIKSELQRIAAMAGGELNYNPQIFDAATRALMSLAALSENSHTNSERTAGTAKAAEPLAGGTVLHEPAPEREGEIAGRESLDPEGHATAGLIVEPAAVGRAERLDGGERPALTQGGDKPSGESRPIEPQADAWVEICGVLDEVYPGWEKCPGKHLVARATHAIKAMRSATQQAYPQPTCQRYPRCGCFGMDVCVDRSEGGKAT